MLLCSIIDPVSSFPKQVPHRGVAGGGRGGNCLPFFKTLVNRRAKIIDSVSRRYTRRYTSIKSFHEMKGDRDGKSVKRSATRSCSCIHVHAYIIFLNVSMTPFGSKRI